jgi:hypothetical protein
MKRPPPPTDPWTKPELDGTSSTAGPSHGCTQPHLQSAEIGSEEARARATLSEVSGFHVYEMPENAKGVPAELEGRGTHDGGS